jgi:hypothetical protein
MQVRERSTNDLTTWKRSALRWLPTFVGFPIGGLAAKLISGPVDGRTSALVGGAISGIALGAVQSWAMGPVGPATRRWIVGTALGLMVGLGIGSAVVDYGTSTGDLAVQGAICGVAVGAAQAIVLRPQFGRSIVAWVPALGALWALGWTVTTAAGVDVESQYTVFGSTGALVVTAATAVLPVVLARRARVSAS